jgi:hypothetical protein
MTTLQELQAHVRSHLASRVQYAQAWRVDELTRLVVRYWPHLHLEEIERLGGPNHKAIDHTMTLVRAQVRERWEAAHGVGPLWQMILGGTVSNISLVILGLWWQDPAWRQQLREMASRVD